MIPNQYTSIQDQWYNDSMVQAAKTMFLLDFLKLVATKQIESFVSAPDFDKSCWFDNKFSLGFDFPNLPYFIDGDIKLTQVIFDIIAFAPFIVKRLKEEKDGENDISDSRHHALHCKET